MKRLLTLVIFPVLTTAAWAEESDLNKAFQSEYTYLVSQKESLIRQKKQMEQSLAQRTAQAKLRTFNLQKQLAQLTAANDEEHENLTNLERQKKELQKRGTSLESTYKKAVKLLSETEHSLRFDTTKVKTEVVPPADLKLSELGPLFEKANQLLRASAREETFQGVYLDGNDQLVQGEVTRIGRTSAFANNQGGRYLLGPNGAGTLKVLEKAEAGSFFLFKSLNETASIKKSATWLEHLADLGPITFLSLMLVLVAGLFSVMVKV